MLSSAREPVGDSKTVGLYTGMNGLLWTWYSVVHCAQAAGTADLLVDCVWNVMVHDDAREGKWRGNWWIEWVASTIHTTSEHGVSSITTADAHTSATSSRLNWRSRRFKWTRPFRRKTKSGFCACAITFQTQSTTWTAQINRLENVSWHIFFVIVAITAIVPCTPKAFFCFCHGNRNLNVQMVNCFPGLFGCTFLSPESVDIVFTVNVS